MEKNNITNILNNVLGVKWLKNGNTLKGFDCYGLVKYVYRQKGIMLPEYIYKADDYKEREQAIRNAKFSSYFKKLDEPKHLSIASIKYFGKETHVGLYLEKNKILHVTKDKGVHISFLNEKVSFKNMKDRIAGYYEYTGEVN